MEGCIRRHPLPSGKEGLAEYRYSHDGGGEVSDPRLLARFAFGYSSPFIAKLGLKSHGLFGMFAGCSFDEIYEMCVQLCS